MYTEFCRHVYLPLIDYVKKAPYQAAYQEACNNQFYTPEKIAQIQLDKLRKILSHAYQHSQFYRNRFDAAGFNPGNLTQISDMANIPFLEKSELSNNMSAIITPGIGSRFKAASSGSTGTALRFEYDSYQQAWMEACRWRGRAWWGLQRGDRELILWGRPLIDKRSTTHWNQTKSKLRNILHINVFTEFNDAFIEQVWHHIQTFKPKIIYGYGSCIGKIATSLLDKGYKLAANDAPVLIEYTGDHMFQFEIDAATTVFSAPVLSQYGASEVPSISNQCKLGHHHISTDNVLIEFITPDGNPAQPGEQGDIILTTLSNYAMPLIRYRVGDYGACSDQVCECGVHLPLMELKVGKSVDVFDTTDKKAVSAYLFDYINKKLLREGYLGIRQFHVTQRKLDDFLVKFVRDKDCPDATIAKFKTTILEKLGNNIHIDTEFVDSIDTPASGKRRYFEKKIQ